MIFFKKIIKKFTKEPMNNTKHEISWFLGSSIFIQQKIGVWNLADNKYNKNVNFNKP